MKYSLLFLAIIPLLINCSKTRQSTTSEQLPPEQIEATTDSSESNEADSFLENAYHFAAYFQFTSDGITFEKAEKVVGDFPLLIAPAFDAFAATYDGDEIISFYAFPDPLEVEQGRSTTGSAMQTLLFPASLSKSDRLEDTYIGVFKVTNYIEDWEAKVKTRTQLKQSLQDGYLKEMYQIDASTLRESLRKAK